MARLRFTLGTRYLCQGQVYVVRQVLVGGQLQIENQSFGGLLVRPYLDLVSDWAQGALRFEVPAPLARPSSEPLATEYTHADFQQLPAELREEAWRRYQLLLPLLRVPPDERSRSHIIAYVASLQTPATARADKRRGELGSALSRASIVRWLSDFQESGYDIRALVPNFKRSARKGERRLDQEQERIIQGVLAECATDRGHRTAQDVYLMVVNRVAEENRTRPTDDPLPLPGQTTVYRRIQDAGSVTILRRCQSRQEAQAEASVGDGPTPTRILERVEFDDTVLDMFVVDDVDRLPIGRPTFSYGLDRASGMPYGIYIGFEPPSYRTVAECLLNGILPKPDTRRLYGTENLWSVYGLVEKMVVDNAKGNIGRDLQIACAQLGIILEVLPVRTPWFKGAIERFFRTQNQGLIHSLPGTTFSNVLDRGDYDTFQRACISLSGLKKLAHIFLIDCYAQRWHKGLNLIPAKRWAQDIDQGFIPCLHTSADEIRIMLMRSENREVQRAGIEFESLYYRSPDLARLRTLLPSNNRTVQIKYDPGDLGAIRVFDPTTERWLAVPAADQDYAAGLSLWKHRIIRRYVLAEKQEVDIFGLAAAKAKIRQIVAAEYANTRKQAGRKQAARFLDIGVESQASTPSSVNPSVTANTPTIVPTSSPESAPVAEAEPDVASSSQSASTSEKPASRRRNTTKATASPSVASPELDPTAPVNDEGWGGDYNLPRRTQ